MHAAYWRIGLWRSVVVMIGFAIPFLLVSGRAADLGPGT